MKRFKSGIKKEAYHNVCFCFMLEKKVICRVISPQMFLIQEQQKASVMTAFDSCVFYMDTFFKKVG